MEILNKRVYATNESTLGILVVDNKPFGFVIEDEKREIKIKGETRIPAGKYKLGLQMCETPLTLKYRKEFSWFQHHIQLLDVPGFTNVYIHIGNYVRDTDGCQIIGMSANVCEEGFSNSKSTICYKALYKIVYPLLKAGKDVYYTIKDE